MTTIGRNNPLNDLAWGLASRGVAVLRFDKVTHAHPAEVASDPEFTATDEYAPAALAAVRLLREHDAINRIFLLGHSLGSTVAPRVAAAEPAIAGHQAPPPPRSATSWACCWTTPPPTAVGPSPSPHATPPEPGHRRRR